MKQKTGPKFFQKLKRKDQFEIRSVEISPEKAVAGLAESGFMNLVSRLPDGNPPTLLPSPRIT